MIWRSITTALALFLMVLLEDSFISALPGALRFIPLVFVSAVLVYHFLRPSIGCAWLVTGGLLLDLVSFPGASHVVTYTLSGAAGLFLAGRVFTNHSLYAMMGLGMTMWVLNSILEDLWVTGMKLVANHPVVFGTFVHFFWVRLAVFSLTLLVAFAVSRRTAVFVKRQFFLRT